MCFCILVGLCVTLWAVVAATRVSSNFGVTPTACLPDGRFSLDPYGYDYWDASGFFEVTLGYGEMTFTEVKVIDVVWDIVSLSKEKRLLCRECSRLTMS
jgi:hypothetical protein